jgi:MFS family permease
VEDASDAAALEREDTESLGPFAALQHRDFRLYWGGRAVSSGGTQMQQAAVAWQVYLLTHSALALGFIGLFRVLPIVVFSLLGGVVADVVNRRALLLITQTWLLLVSAALALVTATGVITLWMIYVLTAMSAAALAFDNPARQALVPSLVSRERLTNALSLMSTALQMATVVGPSLAGLVIAARGVAAVYLIDVLSFLAVIWALLVINPPPVADAVQRVSWTAAVEGLHFVWRSPIILATMGLDFMATFFSSATSLLPIFARDILHVGSEGYGFLYAAPGAGAVVAGVAVSFYSGAIRMQGRVVLLSVAAYGACTVLFGLSRSFALSLLALAGTGAADTVSMIIRQTIRQVVTPDALRGRMTSVTSVFFMGGPQLGEVEAGLVARAFGAPISVISGGLAALLATGLIGYYARGLRRYRG